MHHSTKPKSNTNVEAKQRANKQGVAAATCNPAVDRQPGLRRPGLAEQHCWAWHCIGCSLPDPPRQLRASSPFSRFPFPSFPASLPRDCPLRRSSAPLVSIFEFLDLRSSCLTPSWGPALGRSPCVHRASRHPLSKGAGTESLGPGKVGAVGPLRPNRTHQTKLQDLPELPKLIRNESRA